MFPGRVLMFSVQKHMFLAQKHMFPVQKHKISFGYITFWVLVDLV